MRVAPEAGTQNPQVCRPEIQKEKGHGLCSHFQGPCEPPHPAPSFFTLWGEKAPKRIQREGRSDPTQGTQTQRPGTSENKQLGKNQAS